MKRYLSLFLLSLLFILFLSACGSSTTGPTSWIDKPLDKTRHPLAPLEIITHASSSSGVGSFEVTVDEMSLGTFQVNGGRFEMTALEWVPDEPGVYTIGVTASDSSGNPGSQATSIVYIGDIGLEGEVLEGPGYGDCGDVEHMFMVANPPVILPGTCSLLFWEVLVASDDFAVIVDGKPVDPVGEFPVCPEESVPIELIVESPAGVCRQWQMVYVDEDIPEYEERTDQFINFEGFPPVIDQGECAILLWEVGPHSDILPMIDGQEVDFFGEREVCPNQTTTYYLASLDPQRPLEAFVTIEVIGGEEITPEVAGVPDSDDGPTNTPSSSSSSSGVTPTPTNKPAAQATHTPTPKPVDTTPPSISGASISPSSFIYNTNGSCTPTKFTISANVSDAGGIKSVVLNWTGSGVRSGPATMNGSGGKYTVKVGKFVNTTGQLSNFSITATDKAGNIKKINLGWSVNVEECGGS